MQDTNTVEKINWELTEEDFGPLLPYIKDDNITDVDWDSSALWITDQNGVSKKIYNPLINETFIDNFVEAVSNHANQPFNKTDKVLMADTEKLRITCVHESFVTNGTCVAIRKSLPDLRFTAYEAVKNNYCDEEALHLITNCILAKMNINIMGEPGTGKTECAKFFSSFIPAEEKVITIEDTKEWHYSQVNPGKRCLEMKVNDAEDYANAIKVALRLNPKWIMISEARSREVIFYVEGLSTGVHGISTMHTDDVRKGPDRMVIMGGSEASDNMEDTIYTYLNVGILMKQEYSGNGTKKRKIKQICFYYRDKGENKIAMIWENDQLYKENIPEQILNHFKNEGIENIFYSKAFEERKESERQM